nr:hypothetical protein [Bradyrhizobium elkanii]
MNENRRCKRSPRDLEEIDQTAFVQVNMFVSSDGDPVTLDGEEHGNVAARGKRQVDVDAVYCGKQTGEDFDDRVLARAGPEPACRASMALAIKRIQRRRLSLVPNVTYGLTRGQELWASGG